MLEKSFKSCNIFSALFKNIYKFNRVFKKDWGNAKTEITEFFKKKRNNKNVLHTVVLKDYWDKKDFQDMGPLSVNSIHIRGLLFETIKIL